MDVPINTVDKEEEEVPDDTTVTVNRDAVLPELGADYADDAVPAPADGDTVELTEVQNLIDGNVNDVGVAPPPAAEVGPVGEEHSAYIHESAGAEAASVPTEAAPEAEAHQAIDIHESNVTGESTVEPPLKRPKLEEETSTPHPTSNCPPLTDTVTLSTSSIPEVRAAEPPSPPSRKPRKEFTASEKLSILSELDEPNPPTLKELTAKYGLSKSSFHRWRQPGFKQRLLQMTSGGRGFNAVHPAVSADGTPSHASTLPHTEEQQQQQPPLPSLLYKGDKKRDMSKGLIPLKRALQNFITMNATTPPEDQYAIRSAFLQVKARELRNELVTNAMTRQEEIAQWKEKYSGVYFPAAGTEVCPEPLLTETELNSLKSFKGSKSWACHVASQLGLLNTPWSEAAEANSRKYMEEAQKASSGPLLGAASVKKPKKARTEFTTLDKMRILREIDETNSERKQNGQQIWSVEEICEHYGTSKSSLHRWKQQRRSGQLDSSLQDGVNVKRIFKDRLVIIKRALIDYVEEKKEGGVTPIMYLELQNLALTLRDQLLLNYELANGLPVGGVVESTVEDANATEGVDGVTATENTNKEASPMDDTAKDIGEILDTKPSATIDKDEYQTLRVFKASNSWIRELAKKHNFPMDGADIIVRPDWTNFEEIRSDGRDEDYYQKYELGEHDKVARESEMMSHTQEGEMDHHNQEHGMLTEAQLAKYYVDHDMRQEHGEVLNPPELPGAQEGEENRVKQETQQDTAMPDAQEVRNYYQDYGSGQVHDQDSQEPELYHAQGGEFNQYIQKVEQEEVNMTDAKAEEILGSRGDEGDATHDLDHVESLETDGTGGL